jgi:ABC-2 type transport system ATP-binding protein
MILEINNLTKQFKDFTAVNNITLKIDENKVLAFLGQNGAGKTTTLRMIAGLSEPTSGEIFINGSLRNFGNSSLNSLIGYLPEQPSFYNWMTGKEYLEFIADIFNIPKTKKEIVITNLLKRVSIYEARNKRISAYSNGMRQRLGIAQAIINSPKLLILDEPVSALDPIGRNDVLTLINELKKEMSILISTHILSDVDKICDDIAIIDKGNVIVQSSIEDLKSKYSHNIIKIEFNEIPTNLITVFENQKYITKVESKDRIVRLWLKHTDDKGEKELIMLILDSNYSLLNFTHEVPQIEDLFMEIIKEQ